VNFPLARLALLFLLVASTGIFANAQGSEPLVTGQVVRADNGLPIADATVELRMSHVPDSSGQFPTAISDHNGEYRFRDSVREGSYDIVASAEGFVSKTYKRDGPDDHDGPFEGTDQLIDASTRLRGINFQLQREAIIRGVLTDADGKSAPAGVLVALIRKKKEEELSVWLRLAATTKTDAHGQFEFTKLAAETYLVCVNGPNGLSASPHVGDRFSEVWYGNVKSANAATPVALKEGEERDGLRITVRREQRYQVIVWPSGPEGQVKRARYSLRIAGRRAAYRRNEDGSYVLEGVPPGHYQLASIAWGQADYVGAGDVSFEVTDADVTLHLELGGLGEIEGVLKAGKVRDEVLSEIMLEIESSVTGAAQGSHVDANGYIKFGRVLPGPYEFRALKMPAGVVLRSVRCGGAEVTPAAPLRVGDKQNVTDCEFVLEDSSRSRVTGD
jgi:Carboxypeptidase regulatory-like domain